MSEILWTPDPDRVRATLLWRFMQAAPGAPTDYHDLWRWSVEHPAEFWAMVWDRCGVVASVPYDTVMGEPAMPGTEWFRGARLNFAENLLRTTGDGVAAVGVAEGRDTEIVTWDELRGRVGRVAAGLAGLGVGAGDRVAGLVPNSVEALIAMLAAASLGAVWSSSSPDFGAAGVVDRFGQIDPVVLIAADGYRYNGTVHDIGDKVGAVARAIPSLRHVVTFDFAGIGPPEATTLAWSELDSGPLIDPTFAQLPFDHPLYVMYSSGTTGAPKSIVHGAGGTLVKHLCEHQLHADLRPGDVLFWYTTCGWMMWNWLVSGLASAATVVLYDGSPAHPGPEVLWRLAEIEGITHFGTSPKFLAANANAGAVPSRLADLGAMRSLLSTGAPLNPEQFDWVYANVKEDVQLASVSGGTDLIGCFACGVPILPVRRGELQARTLAMAVEAWDPSGNPVIGEPGELVCTRPFPSMPVGFWNDPDGERYRAAYFDEFPGVWAHGDYVEIRPEGGVIIYGRSDTTLNPGGVRIGTAEIYRAIEGMPEISDSIVVGRPVAGDVEVVLFVKPNPGHEVDDDLVARIASRIREATTPRHVPRRIIPVHDVPYTLSGKKVEKAVRQVIAGREVPNRDALANPGSLDEYAGIDLDGG
jgi:acetoacetyl-CoA synthetase